MPRSGPNGSYSLPPIYLAVPGTTIVASQHNDPLVDIQATFNTAQPIFYGGTGESTPAAALSALGATTAGFLYGLTLANNAGDANNDIDIGTGSARNSTDLYTMVLTGALVKRLDAVWAAGTGNGGRFATNISDATWHVYLIANPTTGIVDVGFSTSATNPTSDPSYPSGFTYFRRIGSIVRTGGSIKGFVQDGDQFMWKSYTDDINTTNPGTSAVTRTLTLPTGIRVLALVTIALSGTTQAGLAAVGYLSALSQNDDAPTVTTGATVVSFATSAISDLNIGATAGVMTNTSAQIRSRVQFSAAGTTLRIGTRGWVDTRGRLAA